MIAIHISSFGISASSWPSGSCGIRTKNAAVEPSSSSICVTTENVAGNRK